MVDGGDDEQSHRARYTHSPEVQLTPRTMIGTGFSAIDLNNYEAFYLNNFSMIIHVLDLVFITFADNSCIFFIKISQL